MPRKARRRAWGSITEASRGRKYVLRWVQNTEQGRKRKTKTFYGTYREACMELDRIHVERADDSPTMTIGAVYEKWYLPWLRRRVESGATKEGTLLRYTDCWNNVIRQRWQNVPVDSTPPLSIQKWLMTLSKGNANTAVVVLRKVMDFAVQYEVVGTNKFRNRYEMPTRTGTRKPEKTLGMAEAVEMLERVHGTEVEAPYILAMFGSARPGEACGPRASEVSIVEARGIRLAVVPIARRVGITGKDPYPDGDLKTPQSVRSIVIPEPFGTRLYSIAQERMAGGVEWLTACPDGQIMNLNDLRYRWRSISGGEVPPSNLRISWRTVAQYEWGLDYDTCEILMGHKLTGVTGQHYLKPSVEQLADKVAEAYTKSGFPGRIKMHLG